MCCFSQPVEIVSDANIFARGANGRQFLVYSMSYAAVADLAMVLPLPVPPDSPEDAVRFINLERYPAFFDDMAAGFPKRMTLFRSAGASGMLSLAAPKLKVHDVGSFDASFVPKIEDFDRLDQRFRIPRQVWDRLPLYCDYGFAVFKLKASAGGLPGFLNRLVRTGAHKPRSVHPMAFEFPRRNPDLLYFPTVHIHDGQVHSRAEFDHMLYCQADSESEEYLGGWEKSDGPASAFMAVKRAEGVVEPDRPCWRRPLEGRLENKDALVGRNGSLPAAVKG